MVGELVWISTENRSARSARALRALLHIWAATCVLATILFSLDGLQAEERALLGMVWPILGLIWVAYRLRASRTSRRLEMDSGGR
jgi:hypothetical protein